MTKPPVQYSAQLLTASEQQNIDNHCIDLPLIQPDQDNVESVETFYGFPVVVLINRSMGSRCGYIGIPFTHPLFADQYAAYDLDCHGGVTFAELGVEHFWIGFDCLHMGDARDVSLMDAESLEMHEILTKHRKEAGIEDPFGLNEFIGDSETRTIKSLEYVRTELVELAKQLMNTHVICSLGRKEKPFLQVIVNNQSFFHGQLPESPTKIPYDEYLLLRDRPAP